LACNLDRLARIHSSFACDPSEFVAILQENEPKLLEFAAVLSELTGKRSEFAGKRQEFTGKR